MALHLASPLALGVRSSLVSSPKIMSLRFRHALPRDLESAAGLAHLSFPGHSEPWWSSFLEDGPFGHLKDSLWCVEEADELVGCCQILPLRVWIGGVKLPVAGVGAVSISPTHRKQGIAKRLMVSALETSHARGDMASMLYPFRASFYGSLGYAPAGEALQHLVSPEAFPASPHARRMRLVSTEEDRAAVARIYQQWAPTRTGMLERTDRMWEETLKSPARAVLYVSPAGIPEGYAIFKPRIDLPPRDRFLEVTEWVYVTNEARSGILGWLSTLGDQWQQILIRSFPSERLVESLSEDALPKGTVPQWGLWYPSATLLRGPMFRLINVEAALSLRSVLPAIRLSVLLEVTDAQLPSNSGAYFLTLEEGQIRVSRSPEQVPDAVMSLSVDALSAIYVGSLSATDAVQLGKAKIDRHDLLPLLYAAFQVPDPGTFDLF